MTMVVQWPRIEVKSGAVVVPKLCPNCMAEATTERRDGHKYLISNTRYYQTFYYCGECHDVLRHETRTGVLQWLIGVPLCIALALLLAMVADTLPESTSPATRALGIATPVVVPIIVGFLIGMLRRRSKRLPASALGRTPAAFYTGRSGAGLGDNDVYRARRQEWLDALVRANPDKVSE